MNYKMEELVPIVGRLASQYTSFESTSVTYEKAEQLMGAVLYCIRETEVYGGGSLVSGKGLSAEKAYEWGLSMVEQKVRQALNLYNELMWGFTDYGSRCLGDTVVKGIPEFFKWYDVKYDPQDTVVMLDYPVLKDLSGCSGADKIYEFICCIRMEQRFLSIFPKEWIVRILLKLDAEYEESVENICEAVMTAAFCHTLEEKPLPEEFSGEEIASLKNKLAGMEEEEVRERFRNMVKGILHEMTEDKEELYTYLMGAADCTVWLRAHSYDRKGEGL